MPRNRGLWKQKRTRARLLAKLLPYRVFNPWHRFDALLAIQHVIWAIQFRHHFDLADRETVKATHRMFFNDGYLRSFSIKLLRAAPPFEYWPPGLVEIIDSYRSAI
jgi:hypothetical protein